MALITTQRITAAGTKPTYAAAAAGDTAKVGPGHFLIVKNASGSSINLTIAVPGNQQSGIANDPVVIAVAATTGEAWVPLGAYFANATDRLAHITYSSTTSVTTASIKV